MLPSATGPSPDAGLKAAHRFDHAFPSGAITVVLGSNRAGKTNLCRLIAGLDTQAEGSVRFDGEDLNTPRARQAHASMVYQTFVNYPNMSVRDNIASPLKARKLPRAETAAAVEELAARLAIGELLDRTPAELSGGQQQRVAIARALAKEARVVLLDEPLVNLDFKLREALEVELRDVLTASGATVIYTSSDPRDVFMLADEVLLLSDGRKLQSGPPLEVYERPASVETMDLLCDPAVNRFVMNGEACALRPEHVSVEAQAASDLRFPAEITAFETNGAQTFLHCRVGDGADWVVRHDGMLDLDVGDQITLTARDADVRRWADG